MDKFLKKLIIVFIILVFLKVIISLFVSSPTIFADEYYYMKMARSFNYDGNFNIDGEVSDLYPPLYPIIISISYLFKNPETTYLVIKIINAILSSLIIIPIWLLGKEFLDKRKALIVSLIIGIMPPFFALSPYILSENLFFTLFLFSIYFLYKSFTENKIKFDILAGIFIGLTYLTRVIAMILFPLVIIILIYHLIKKRDFSQIKRKLILLLVSLITISPWLIRNVLTFGFSIQGMLGYSLEVSSVKSNFSLPFILYWILLYLSYLILASGILFFSYSIFIKKIKNENLNLLFIITFVSTILLIIISSIHSGSYPFKYYQWLTGRPFGRYIEEIIPLIILLGFIAINNKEVSNFVNKKRYTITIIISLMFLASYPLVLNSLFPVNNSSLSYFGVLKFFLNIDFIIILLFILSPLFILKFYNLNFNKIAKLFFIFFLLVSILVTSINIYNSTSRWNTLEQTSLGKWLNSNTEKDAVFMFDRNELDEDFGLGGSDISTKPERSIRVIGSWLNKDIIIGNIEDPSSNVDYIITTRSLNFPIFSKTEQRKPTIFVYKIN